MNFFTTIYRVLNTKTPEAGEVWEHRELSETEAIIVSNIKHTVRARLKRPLDNGAFMIEDDENEFKCTWKPKPEEQRSWLGRPSLNT